MFRRIGAYAGALFVLVLAGCQDSGPLGLDGGHEKSLEFMPFGGAWAAVTGPLSEPNLLLNGEFESGFAPWVPTLGPPAVPFFDKWSEWEVGTLDLLPFLEAPFAAGTPHAEPLDASIPPDGSGASAQVFARVATLVQGVTLPALEPGEKLWLAYNNRIKNFATSGFPGVGPMGEDLWEIGLHDYRVEIDAGGGPVVLWSAAAVGAPAFSGGGDATTAFYVPESFDISAFFSGGSVVVSFIIEGGPPLIVDLDDILLYVELATGGDPDPIEFEHFSVKKAKVKIHKPKKHDKKNKDKDEFEVEGRITFGEDSDGFDLLTEDLTIKFGDLEFVIEAGSFVRKHDDDDDGEWKLRGKKPGITKFELEDNGEFEVKAKGLNLWGLELGRDHPVEFTLTIGDDTGTFNIPFDKKGKFKGRKHDDDDD